MATDPRGLAAALAPKGPAPQPLQAPPPARSQYYTDALRQLQDPGQPIGSRTELGAKLLAQAVNQYGRDQTMTQERGEQEQAFAQLVAEGQQLFPNDASMAQLYARNPQAVMDSFLKAHEPRTVGGSLVFGNPNKGGQVYTPPTLGQSGDQFYTQTPEGVQITGRRDPTYAETETARSNEADEARAREALALQAELGRGNLLQRQQEHAARIAQEGYGTPGAIGQVLGPSLPPGWEIQP